MTRGRRRLMSERCVGRRQIVGVDSKSPEMNGDSAIESFTLAGRMMLENVEVDDDPDPDSNGGNFSSSLRGMVSVLQGGR